MSVLWETWPCVVIMPPLTESLPQVWEEGPPASSV